MNLPRCNSPDPADLSRRLAEVRAATLALVDGLSEADVQVQSMPDASPAKWHLAHTTWFFETLVLEGREPGFAPHLPAYRVLFNSYYNGIGEQHARPQRGLITRPGLADVLAYRRAVDERLQRWLRGVDAGDPVLGVVELGLQHEQQHQELILTDLLHLLSCNPLAPAVRPLRDVPTYPPARLQRWIDFDGGRVEIGHDGRGFAFDNEGPRHSAWLAPYALADRLVTQGEWLAFVDDGGYREPRWWLSAGWDWLRQQRVEAPAYWRRDAVRRRQVYGLHGEQPLDPATPVQHVSFYEADAYAHWLGAQTGAALRLPTEVEWEHAAASRGPAGFFNVGWQWTRSAYGPYPGFRPWGGAVGEYNGKFMANQYVLRGGSLATPRSHLRVSYRNFFPAEARWQFTGVRLAKDL